MSLPSPEYFAKEMIADLGITALPVDPFSIVTELDIIVAEEDADNFDGCLLRSISGARIILNKNIGSQGRKNFTLAHEIGHYSIPTHRGDYKCLAKHLDPFGKNPPEETEANKFASELLLPESLFKPLVHQFKPDFEDLSDLAVICNTSLTATTLKYVSLTAECCALIASHNNIIEWSWKSPSFTFYILKGVPAARGTLTASYMHEIVPKAPASQKTDAGLWIEGKGVSQKTELFESCVPAPKYGHVLTLLWLLDSFGEDDEETHEYRYEEGPWKWTDPKE